MTITWSCTSGVSTPEEKTSRSFCGMLIWKNSGLSMELIVPSQGFINRARKSSLKSSWSQVKCCMYTWTTNHRAHEYTHSDTHTHTHTHTHFTYACTHARTHARSHIHTYIHTYLHKHAHTRTQSYAHSQTHTAKHAHTYTLHTSFIYHVTPRSTRDSLKRARADRLSNIWWLKAKMI